jgi:dipeptidyl aminopeptidase/acylaminoacyl peptidase
MAGSAVSTAVLWFAALAALAPSAGAAAAKLSEREAMYYRYLEFASRVKGGAITPHWMADGHSFWYEEATQSGKRFYKVDPEANTGALLLDMARLRAALRAIEPDRDWPTELVVEQLSLLSEDTVARLTSDSREYLLRLDTYAASKAPSAPPNPYAVPRKFFSKAGWGKLDERLSPDGLWLVGISDHNLYVRSTRDGRIRQLTDDGEEWDEYVLDRGNPGDVWSPDRARLAVRKLDYRQVPEAHRPVPESPHPVLPYTIEYETRTGLFIFDVPSGRGVSVEPGREHGEDIRILGWRRDGSELLYLIMDRTYKRLDLRAANATTGATRVIVSERQDTFSLGTQSSWWSQPLLTPLKDSKRFIWRSERDGWNHLYLYRFDGTLLTRLTSGKFPVIRVEAVDEQEGWVYFTASGDRRRPYDTHLYRVTLEGRGFQQLTKQPGQHTVAFAPSRQYYLDTHSAPDRPPAVELRQANGRLRRVLSRADVEALAELKWRPPDPFVVKAADGRTDLYGLLYKPYDFSPSKQYPVIDHIYAGPHGSVMALSGRFVGWWMAVEAQALAQLGFLVLIVDARGTPGRGKEFQHFGHGERDRHQLLDHVAALRALARERPYMDLGRVGVFGRSYGGYMVLRAMLAAPEVYHVGFASDAHVNLDGNRGYVPYLGWEEEHPEAYARVSVLPLVARLKGKLMLNHGEGFYAREATKMLQAFSQAGKSVDLLLPLPGQDHFLGGKYTTHWREGLRKYFQEHLKP